MLRLRFKRGKSAWHTIGFFAVALFETPDTFHLAISTFAHYQTRTWNQHIMQSSTKDWISYACIAAQCFENRSKSLILQLCERSELHLFSEGTKRCKVQKCTTKHKKVHQGTIRYNKVKYGTNRYKKVH